MSTTCVSKMLYWESLWYALQKSGWSLSHVSCEDDQGKPAHMVCAMKADHKLICTATIMSLAVQVLFAEAVMLETDSNKSGARTDMTCRTSDIDK